MGLRSILKGHRVYFDAMIFIYLLEGYRELRDRLDDIQQSLKHGEIEAVTSELTLCETLVAPFRRNQPALASKYREFIESSGAFALIPVDRDIWVRASLYRAQFRLATPDAIHMASAVKAECSLFLTNDKAIRGPNAVRVVMIDAT
jgi:predicted nucleic acid-binding protein